MHRRSIPPNRGTLALLLLGAASVWCWWHIAALGDVRLQLAAFYGWFAAAFGLYLLALRLVGRWEASGGSRGATGLALGVIVAAALLARVAVLPTTPTLSDDIYRYLWDGRVQLTGMHPYAYPPNAPELVALRDGLWEHINFPHLRTIYPPVTQKAFLLGAWLSPTLTAQKLVFVSAELIVMACLVVLLRLRGANLLWVAAYAWHPLAVLEIAGSGHNDAVGLACLWVGLVCWHVKRPALAAVAWAGAFLSKYVTVILAPWWWFRRGASRRWLFLFGGLAALPIFCCPAIVSALFESLLAMAARFESNSSIYLLLATAIHHPGLARVLVTILWIAFVIWWAHRQSDPLKFLLGGLAAAACLSPVLHPWYLLWIIPMFCFWRPAALIAWTGLAVLAYTVWPGYLGGGPWKVPSWAHVLEYVPVYLLGAWEVARSFDSLRSLRIVVSE